MSASRLLRQPAGHPLHSLRRHANLPSRTSYTLCPRARAFHATAPRKDGLDALLTVPHELLQYLHMGLPWYAAIPASAFILRGVLVSTLGARVRASTGRYIALNPLRNAVALGVSERMLRTQSFKSHQEGIRAISKAVGKETKALNERWACSIRGQIGWTFAQLPIFLVMAEVIRRLCGTKDGLLRMAMNAFGISQPTNPEASVLSNAYATDVATNPWFDPSLTTEGMLWFQDLTAADPMGMLSYIASGLMFINVYGTQNGVTNSETTKGSKRLRRVLLLVSLLIGPMCAQLPAGLLLYWTGSTTSAIVWNQWLDRKYPVITGIQPCKRPLFVIPTANRPSLPTPKPAGR